jgi:hypothetical protein
MRKRTELHDSKFRGKHRAWFNDFSTRGVRNDAGIRGDLPVEIVLTNRGLSIGFFLFPSVKASMAHEGLPWRYSGVTPNHGPSRKRF